LDRSREVRGATWAEINAEAKVWTVPADRMKAGKEHRVPLSYEALALLEPTGARKLRRSLGARPGSGDREHAVTLRRDLLAGSYDMRTRCTLECAVGSHADL